MNRHTFKRKVRWWFSKWPWAELLNRSERTCWCDLVTWAMHKRTGDRDEDRYNSLRYSVSGGRSCRERTANPPHEAERACYCGKFADGCMRADDWTYDQSVKTDAS